jgi:serine/threonine-protein kinase
LSVTLEQPVQHLADSGLMTAAEGLARALVRANKLTPYQAQTLYQGKSKGLTFGEYRVPDKLGHGGMGVVLKAEHRRMHRLVAVKMGASPGHRGTSVALA